MVVVQSHILLALIGAAQFITGFLLGNLRKKMTSSANIF
jgi:hypothetical protein